MAKEVIRQDVIEVGFNADIKSLDRFDKEMSNLWDAVKKGKADFNKFRESVEDTDDSVDDIGKKSLPEFEKGLNGIGKGAVAAEKDVESLSDILGGLEKKSSFFGKFSSGMAGLGIAVGAGAMIGNVNDMSKAINQFQAKTGTNVKEMQQYGNAMKEVYNNGMGDSWGDVADSFAVVKTNMGLAGDELKNTANNALLLRDTFDFDVTESTRAASMMMKQFGLTSDEAYNFIVQGAQSGLDKNGDLLDTINEYSVHFKQLGFGAEDMFNMLVNGTEDGTFSVDKLGDSIKEFGIRVIDGSDTTKAGFAEIGLNADTMAKKFSLGGESAREAFNQTVKGLQEMKDPIAQNTAGVNLFGTMWEDLGKEGIFALSDVKGEISNTSTALENINNIKYDEAGSALVSLGRTVNTALAGAVGDAVNSARGYINDFMAGFNGENGGAFFAQIGEGMRIGIDKAKLALQDFKAGLQGTDSGTFFSNIGIAAEKVGTIISKVTGFLAEHKTVTKSLIVSYTAFKGTMAGINAILEVKSKLDKAATTMSKLKTKLVKKEAAATLGETAATTAQTTATGAATVAQTGLNTAMKACPIVAIVGGIAALAVGLTKLAKKYDPINKKIEENSKKIRDNMAGVEAFSEIVDNCEPILTDYNKLLSNNGNLMSDIDTSISNTENAITNILQGAFEEQRGLRASDLADIEQYNKKLMEYNAEKLGIYQLQQQAVIIDAQMRLEQGTLDPEESAQVIKNAETAMENSKTAVNSAYMARLTQNENMKPYISEEDYQKENEAALEWQKNQIQIVDNMYSKVLGIAEESSLELVKKNDDVFAELNRQGAIWAENYIEWYKPYKMLGPDYTPGQGSVAKQAMSNYDSALGTIDTEQVSNINAMLQQSMDIIEKGQTLSEKTKGTISAVFRSFDNVPDNLEEDAKQIILGMVKGMEENIHELANASEMSCDEIANTVEKAMDINSPSKRMMVLGEYTSQGMLDGIKSKQPRFTESGGNIVTGLISGINNKKPSAINAARSLAEAINREFDKIQDINSPSKVWEEKGQYLIEGLNIGLEKGSESTQKVYKRKPILPAYTGENSTVNKNSTRQNITYSSPINITVNGGGDSRQTARSVKNAVKEGIKEMMSSFEYSNKPVREF